jgi:general secretion pathway protein L
VTLNQRWRWSSFWRWWREGLLAWLPLSVRRWLVGSSRRLLLVAGDGELLLSREENGFAQVLERLDPITPQWNTISGWYKTEKPRQLVLRLPAAQALVRVLTLPLAAEKNLYQVAGFEMDRLTPFTVAQVYYAVTVLERQPEQRRLRVKLTALPRSNVDLLLTPLQQHGLSVDVLDIVGSETGLNLLPPEKRVTPSPWRQWGWGILIGVALLLALVAVILPIWQQRLLVIGVMTQASQLQQRANQALALREQLDRSLEASKMLTQKKRLLPVQIHLLRELTTILPDDTWLERLQIKGDTVQLVGQSAKASALVGVVESSDWFGNAGFVSPVTTDTRTNKERFILSAKVTGKP